MTNILNIRGYKFTLEGDGFVSNHAEVDFEAISDRIETVLKALPEADLARLHAGAQMGADMDDFIDRAAFDELDSLADRERRAVVAGWYNPSAVSVMISAHP